MANHARMPGAQPMPPPEAQSPSPPGGDPTTGEAIGTSPTTLDDEAIDAEIVAMIPPTNGNGNAPPVQPGEFSDFASA
jgi:hypothetical protein